MIDRDAVRPEPGLLVGVDLADERDPWPLEASMDELAALAESAGVVPLARASQRLPRANAGTLVGTGKVEELRLAAAELGAEVILFDRELSPRQQRNLERAIEVKVIDRTALILDVFARHARTREGMLQVELAQYEYRLPRLTRMWTHLARQAGGRAGGSTGGVGVRGPGETQLEIDRREIGRRIAHLKKQIDTLRTQRRQARRQRHRAGLPVIALVGYTNAGKSTLLAHLTDADVLVADQLFATLDPTTRRLALPSGRGVLLTDTVGFIQKLPTQLVAAFRATLEEVTEADLLLHVVDATHPDAVLQAETVERVLADLGMHDPPMVVAANKVDLVDDRGPDGPVGRLVELYPDVVPISARDGTGVDDLLLQVEAELRSRLVPVELVVPYADGELLHRIHAHGVVEHEVAEETGVRLRALVPGYMVGSLRDFVTDE